MGQHAKYRPLVRIGAFALAVMVGANGWAEPCRQALALGLDVSGSVDAEEYRLQLDGLASAFSHPDVAGAVLSPSGAPMRLAVYEWSGPQDQKMIVPWTTLSDAGALSSVIARLRATTRSPANPSTALGTAIAFGAALLARQPDCWKRTLDISGDGQSNTGPRPQDISGLPVMDGVTVNALVIGPGVNAAAETGSEGDLQGYFRARVIRGPGAFVETAKGFSDYQGAMVRKLLREMEGLALSRL